MLSVEKINTFRFCLSNSTNLGCVMGSASLYLVNPTQPENKHGNRLDIFYFIPFFGLYPLLVVLTIFFQNFNLFFNLISFSLFFVAAYFDLFFTSSVFSLHPFTSKFPLRSSSLLSDCSLLWWVNYVVFLRFTRFLLGF